MSVSGKINLRINFDEVLALDLGSKSAAIAKALLISLEDGSGLNQISKVWADSFSQANSVNTDIDLNTGPTGPFGAVTFTTLKGIIVIAGADNPGVLTIGNVTNGIVGPFGAADESQKVHPGGVYMNINPTASGWTVTAGTVDLVRIASAATAGTYTGDIILLGT